MSGPLGDIPEGMNGDFIRNVTNDPEYQIHVLTELQRNFEALAVMKKAAGLTQSLDFNQLTPALWGSIVSGLHDLPEVLGMYEQTLRLSATVFDDPMVLEMMAKMVDEGRLD